MSRRTMKVYPNPWGVHPRHLTDKTLGGTPRHSIDRHGRPCHHVMVSALSSGHIHAFVGAEIDKAGTVVDRSQHGLEQKMGAEPLGSPPQVTVWKYLGVPTDAEDFCEQFARKEPVEVPQSAYYVHALKSGDLLPGDGAARNVAGYECRPSDFAKLERLAMQAAGFPVKASGKSSSSASSGASDKKEGSKS